MSPTQYTIRKVHTYTISTRTGVSPRRTAAWHVVRVSDGRVMDSCRTRKDAERCIRLMPESNGAA